MIVVAAVLFGLLCPLRMSTFSVFVGTALAADQSSYGEKKEVATIEEALKAIKKYFTKKDMAIGEVIEKELYYEAEIKDLKNTVIDKVIVDKRTGRIRSIY